MIYIKLCFAAILITLSSCTTPITGETKLQQQDVVTSAQTQLKYVSGELRPQDAYNYYVSRPVQNARESILFEILKKEYGENYARKLAAQGSIEELSPVKIISVSEVSTSYSKQAHWRSFIYTTVEMTLSDGKTKRVKYKSTVSLASSIAADKPIVSLASFEVIGVHNI